MTGVNLAFIELTEKARGKKWTINANAISSFASCENETIICFFGEGTSLKVKEDYETVRTIINKAGVII